MTTEVDVMTSATDRVWTRLAPSDMDAGDLLELTLQLRHRCCMCSVTQELHDRSKALEAECLRRMTLAAPEDA